MLFLQAQVLCPLHRQVQVPDLRKALRHQHAAEEAHGRARARGQVRVRAVRREAEGEVVHDGTHESAPRGEAVQVSRRFDAALKFIWLL